MSVGAPRDAGLRLAVAGKGGAGKSVIAGTVARLLARRGRPVLALDSDTFPGLALSLGAQVPPAPPLLDAAEKNEEGRWRLRSGLGPVGAIHAYSTPAPDGVRLLQSGKSTSEGMAPIMGSVNAFYAVIHRLARMERRGRAVTLRDWDIIGDMPAGPRQTAFGWAPYAKRLLLVVEPTWQSMLTARRIMRIAITIQGQLDVSIVVNKATSEEDAARIEDFLAQEVLGIVPIDEGVRAAERLGAALLDHAPESPAVRAIEALADRLQSASIAV